eukprot:m.173866 g.173866  ORF g.173866 m.173866 type:complete len:1980 (+) comp15313_c4_seq1:157-6096(+)
MSFEEQIRGLFDGSDVDGSGDLDEYELHALLERMGVPPEAISAQVENMFSMLDSVDRKMNFTQFLTVAENLVGRQDGAGAALSPPSPQPTEPEDILTSSPRRTHTADERLTHSTVSKRNSGLSDAKRAHLRSLFQAVDEDGSGSIGTTELLAILRDQQVMSTSDKRRRGSSLEDDEFLICHADAVMATLDVSGDGTLDFEEFCAAMAPLFEDDGSVAKNTIWQAEVQFLSAELAAARRDNALLQETVAELHNKFQGETSALRTDNEREVHTLEEGNQQLNTRIAELERLNARLVDKIEKQEKSIATLEQENASKASSQARVSDAQINIQRYLDEIDQLQEKLDETKKMHATAWAQQQLVQERERSAFEKFRAEAKQREEKASLLLATQVEEAQRQLEVNSVYYETQIRELREELLACKAQERDMSDLVCELEKHIQETDKITAKASREYGPVVPVPKENSGVPLFLELSESIVDDDDVIGQAAGMSETQTEILQQQLKDAEALSSKFQSALATMEVDLIGARQALSAQQASSAKRESELQSQLETLRASHDQQLTLLKQQQQQAQEYAEAHGRELAASKAAVEQLLAIVTAREAEAQTRVEALLVDVDKDRQTLQALRLDYSHRESEVAALKQQQQEDNVTLRQQLIDLEEQLVASAAREKEAEARIQGLFVDVKGEHKANEAALADLSKSLHTAEQRIASLQAELDEAYRQIAILKIAQQQQQELLEQQGTATATNTSQLATIQADLEQQLAAAVARECSAQTQIQSLKLELEESNKALQSFRADFARFDGEAQTQIARLHAESQDQVAQIAALEAKQRTQQEANSILNQEASVTLAALEKQLTQAKSREEDANTRIAALLDQVEQGHSTLQAEQEGHARKENDLVYNTSKEIALLKQQLQRQEHQLHQQEQELKEQEQLYEHQHTIGIARDQALSTLKEQLVQACAREEDSSARIASLQEELDQAHVTISAQQAELMYIETSLKQQLQTREEEHREREQQLQRQLQAQEEQHHHQQRSTNLDQDQTLAAVESHLAEVQSRVESLVIELETSQAALRGAHADHARRESDFKHEIGAHKQQIEALKQHVSGLELQEHKLMLQMRQQGERMKHLEDLLEQQRSTQEFLEKEMEARVATLVAEVEQGQAALRDLERQLSQPQVESRPPALNVNQDLELATLRHQLTLVQQLEQETEATLTLTEDELEKTRKALQALRDNHARLERESQAEIATLKATTAQQAKMLTSLEEQLAQHEDQIANVEQQANEIASLKQQLQRQKEVMNTTTSQASASTDVIRALEEQLTAARVRENTALSRAEALQRELDESRRKLQLHPSHYYNQDNVQSRVDASELAVLKRRLERQEQQHRDILNRELAAVKGPLERKLILASARENELEARILELTLNTDPSQRATPVRDSEAKSRFAQQLAQLQVEVSEKVAELAIVKEQLNQLQQEQAKDQLAHPGQQELSEKASAWQARCQTATRELKTLRTVVSSLEQQVTSHNLRETELEAQCSQLNITVHELREQLAAAESLAAAAAAAVASSAKEVSLQDHRTSVFGISRMDSSVSHASSLDDLENIRTSSKRTSLRIGGSNASDSGMHNNSGEQDSRFRLSESMESSSEIRQLQLRLVELLNNLLKAMQMSADTGKQAPLTLLRMDAQLLGPAYGPFQALQREILRYISTEFNLFTYNDHLSAKLLKEELTLSNYQGQLDLVALKLAELAACDAQNPFLVKKFQDLMSTTPISPTMSGCLGEVVRTISSQASILEKQRNIISHLENEILSASTRRPLDLPPFKLPDLMPQSHPEPMPQLNFEAQPRPQPQPQPQLQAPSSPLRTATPKMAESPVHKQQQQQQQAAAPASPRSLPRPADEKNEFNPPPRSGGFSAMGQRVHQSISRKALPRIMADALWKALAPGSHAPEEPVIRIHHPSTRQHPAEQGLYWNGKTSAPAQEPFGAPDLDWHLHRPLKNDLRYTVM